MAEYAWSKSKFVVYYGGGMVGLAEWIRMDADSICETYHDSRLHTPYFLLAD